MKELTQGRGLKKGILAQKIFSTLLNLLYVMFLLIFYLIESLVKNLGFCKIFSKVRSTFLLYIQIKLW